MDKFLEYKIKNNKPTFILLFYQYNKILIEFYKINFLTKTYKLISELHVPSLKEKQLIENVLIQYEYNIKQINDLWIIAIYQSENIDVYSLKIYNDPLKRHKYFCKLKF